MSEDVDQEVREFAITPVVRAALALLDQSRLGRSVQTQSFLDEVGSGKEQDAFLESPEGRDDRERQVGEAISIVSEGQWAELFVVSGRLGQRRRRSRRRDTDSEAKHGKGLRLCCPVGRALFAQQALEGAEVGTQEAHRARHPCFGI